MEHAIDDFSHPFVFFVLFVSFVMNIASWYQLYRNLMDRLDEGEAAYGSSWS